MNNLPAKSRDIWKKATEADKASALASLSALPSRATGNETIDKGSYYVALDGVTYHGLVEAVRAILKGSLGHTFFPSPVEMRRECDRAMSWHERERQRIANHEQRRQENIAIERAYAMNTPDARARVSKLYTDFCKSYAKPKPENSVILDPELLAQIPDRPDPRGK